MAEKKYLLQMQDIVKTFPGVKALKGVKLDVGYGEIHALMGENGAGKSTLLNILHGVYNDYEGDVLINGEKIHFKNAHDALAFFVVKVT